MLSDPVRIRGRAFSHAVVEVADPDSPLPLRRFVENEVEQHGGVTATRDRDEEGRAILDPDLADGVAEARTELEVVTVHPVSVADPSRML